MEQLTTNQILGSLITYNRTKAGVSLSKLSADLDISYQHLWDTENNQRTVTEPRIESIIQLLETTPEIFWSYLPKAIQKLKQKIADKQLN